MKIIVTLDFVSEMNSSYQEARLQRTMRKPLIVSACRNLFSFVGLDDGYEVIGLKRDGSYCRLSELLNNTHKYIDKIIRRAHNPYKMLKRDALTFRQKDRFSSSCLFDCGKIMPQYVGSPHKMVEVYVDYTPTDGVCSFEESEVLRSLGKGFKTSCFEYFNFDLLDDGYSVLALKEDGSFCDLSEFLSNNFRYMNKEIRRSHQADKFLISNAVSFRGSSNTD